jgi:hypothetical protein
MTIHAIALLQIKGFTPPAGSAVRVEPLKDGVLLHLNTSFAVEPEALALRVRALVGEQLDQHRDARGILFIPDVAAPKARTYEAVVDEIGEGGSWAAVLSSSGVSAAGAGGLDALLGSMLAQMPPSVLQAASGAAQGEPGALAALSQELRTMMGKGGDWSALADQLQGTLAQAVPQARASAQPEADLQDMLSKLGGATDLASVRELLGSAGVDAADPQLQELVSKMQDALQRDPAQLAALAERLFGVHAVSDGDEDDEA